MRILSFSEAAARKYDEIRTMRLQVGRMDLRIAFIVLAANGTLVTRNLSEFSRVPDLPCEDWSR
jgi:tRNA(fMet)-specific endonuclease VapC